MTELASPEPTDPSAPKVRRWEIGLPRSTTASPQHRDASALCASAESAVSLTPDQVHAVGEPIYRGKFDPDYARPGKQELLDHWRTLGLSGDYWTL